MHSHPCRRKSAIIILLGLASVFVTTGCGPNAPQLVTPGESQRNLALIQAAYMQALEKLGRAPANRTELAPFLAPHGDPDKLLRSPDDGNDYVIAWGVDYRTYESQGQPAPVIAYEKTGREGLRWIMRIPDIQQVRDTELKNFVFAPGFEPK